jgi:hypothetical protein
MSSLRCAKIRLVSSISQVRRQFGGRELDLRFKEHVAMATRNFDDTEFSGDYAAPAELRIQISANRSEAASKEYNSTIVWLWPVSQADVIHVRGIARRNWTTERDGPR